MSEYDAVLFDNDGVLVNLCEFSVFLESTRRAFEGFGIDPSDADVDAVAGVSDPDSIARVCLAHGLDPESFWRRRDREAHLAQRAEVRAGRKTEYPDTDVALSLSVPTGIVSSNQHETVRFLVEHFGWDSFETYYGREHSLAGVRRKKPATHYVERAMRELDASHPLFVGDSESDVLAARNAGLDSVFLRRPHREGYALSAEPTYELDSLEGLSDLL